MSLKMRAEYSISNDKNWMGQREYHLVCLISLVYCDWKGKIRDKLKHVDLFLVSV